MKIRARQVKKHLFGYSLIFILFSALGFAHTYFLPRAEVFLLEKLNSLGASHPLAHLHAQDLHINPLLLGISVEGIEIKAKGDLRKKIGRIKSDSLFARLSLLGLIRGQVRIAQVTISSLEAQMILDLSSKENTKINIPLEDIYKIPIDAIEVENITLLGRIDPQKTVFKFEGLTLKAENRYRSLWLDIDAPFVFLKPSGPAPAVQFQAEARGLVETDQIRLTALKVKHTDSFLVSSGFFWGDITKAQITSSEMASKLFFEMPSLEDWFAAFAPHLDLPRLGGAVNITSSSGIRDGKPFLNLKFDGEDLLYEKYEIGDVSLDGTLSDNSIEKLSGKIKNRSGVANLQSLKLSFNDSRSFSFTASPNIEIGTFLSTIGIKDIPVHFDVSGKTQCQGSIKPSFSMKCSQAEARVQNAHVYSKKQKLKNTIVQFKEGTAKGSFEVTSTDIHFAADLTLGKSSKGSGKGSVNFKNGFTIFYTADQFHFSDIQNLANLKLEGNGSFEGETRGNSRTAKMSLNAKMKDFWLDDFGLGQIAAQVSYDRGYLHFKEAAGLYGTTRYAGHVSINLLDDQIYLFLKSPFLELSDIRSSLERRLPMDFQLTGSGNAEVKASGPLDITQLNYEAKAILFRGAIAGETYDSINAQARAQDGVLNFQNVLLKKGPGHVNLTGVLRPKWSVDLKAVGNNLRLEQAEHLIALGLDIQGNYSFDSKIAGALPHPTVEIDVKTKNVIMGSLPVEDSSAQLKINENFMAGTAELLGNKLSGSFTLPFQDSQPFALKATGKELNIASIFQAVSKARQTYDFETKTSFDVDLSSQSGGFWKSTGKISISEFLIRRGSQSLSSDGAMAITFNQGVMNSNNFGISGDNGYLRMELKPSTMNDINGRLNGKLDLNIISPFVTFASEVRGTLSLNTTFSGTNKDFNISGSAYLDRGYLKAIAFPHPFTEIRADMLFNQKSLYLNSFQAEVADGKVNGDGRIRYENAQMIPVAINGHIKDASINFPEGYKTRGQAKFSVQGQNFPYRFKMDYDVSSAEIISEFGEGEKSSGVRRSPYLPPSLTRTASEPFFLDLTIKFLNPLAISNSMVKASFKGDLNIQGDAQNLRMNGGLTPMPGGIVFFREVPFEISTGFIEYDSVAPENPKLYIAASARVGETIYDEDRRQTEKQYDVNMLVQGRAQNPQLTLTSQPPLPQKDIVSLLALGLTPEALDDSRTSGLQVTATSTTALGAALLQKPVGRRLKDNFGVDMKVTSSQASPEVASSAKVTLSKQWTPKLSISASGTIEANPQNSVKLEYQMKRGLSVIGSWESREQSAILDDQAKDIEQSILGLDLEYRFQFK